MSDLEGNLLEQRQASLDGPSGKSAVYKVFWSGAMLVSGTFATIFVKAMYESQSVGSAYCNVDDDLTKDCNFNKPWFSVLIMKLAMSLCLVLYYVFGLKENSQAKNPSWSTIKVVAGPAALDLLDTILGNLGLVFVSSSIYQMVRIRYI